MTADSNSHIAWQRAQLKKLRAALKAIEVEQFGKANCGRQTQMTIDDLQRKIGESGRCIAEYERQTRRPLGTDVRSLSSVSWEHWNANLPVAKAQRQRA